MVEPPDFLAIGHVTKDLLPGGGYSIGGTATYAALTAQRLGVSVAVLTSAPPELDLGSALPHVALHVIPSQTATTFENLYEGGKRRQFVHGIASPLKVVHLPEVWKLSPIVLLCPLVRELDLDWIGVFPAAIVGVTPQGWMRQWDDQGLVTPRAWTEAQFILPYVGVLVYSEEDVACDETLIRHYAKLAKISVVTRGWRGATVYCHGTARDFPAFRAKEMDPTGAGDVFAAAFLIRFKETGDPYQAAHFANCAASFCIEGPGTTAIPTRAQVEERLRYGKLYR